MMLGSYTLGWAFTILLCFKLFHGAWGNCGPPPVIPNTNPVEETFGTPGQSVVYTCDRNTGYYEIPDKSRTITCEDNGNWTAVEEFCARACGVPDRLSFAEPAAGALDKNFFPPGTTVTYNCRPGYIRRAGRNSITCLENFTWSTPDVFCQRRSCGNPGEVENAEMEGIDFLFGSRVSYNCNTGYRLASRRNFRDCTADGTWSNDLPQCDAVICAAPNKPDNGEYHPQKDEYTYLDSVTFSCKKPYEVVGEATISCTANGEWSSNTPTCKDVTCSEPTVANSRKVSGFSNQYKLNSAITFECLDHYVLNGTGTISCNIDSQWIPAIPKCDRLCGDPGTIQNGQKSGDIFPEGSSVIYTCNKGYTLTSLSSRTCQKDGTWSGSLPTCAAVSCGDPEQIKNGRVSVSNHFYGGMAVYTCEKGYKITSSNSRTCQEDRTWSGSPPTCAVVSCGDPEQLKNGRVSVSNHFYGGMASYTCEEGYNLTSSNSRTCQEDGTWSGSPPTCADGSAAKGLSPGAIAGSCSLILLCTIVIAKLKFV